MTSKQNTPFDAIDEATTADGGVCPLEDLRRHTRLKSESDIHRLVKALETRGVIRRLLCHFGTIEMSRNRVVPLRFSGLRSMTCNPLLLWAWPLDPSAEALADTTPSSPETENK